MQLLAWGTDPEAPYDRQRAEWARELAWEVVAHDFDHFEAKAARVAWAAEKRLAAGFYALSVERWGRRVEWRGPRRGRIAGHGDAAPRLHRPGPPSF